MIIRLLIWLGLYRPATHSDYCDWPKPNAPLRISHTILPEEYINHINEDKEYYSQTIVTI